VKPIHLDFDSPIHGEIFVKAIRKTSASNQADEPVLVSEIVPGNWRCPTPLGAPVRTGFDWSSKTS